MKTHLYLSPILIVLLLFNQAKGQIDAFKMSYPEYTTSNVHIVGYDSENSSLMNYQDSATGRQFFLFTNYYTDSLHNIYPHSRKYTPILTSGLGEIFYTVNDMKKVGNTCFICGQMLVPCVSVNPPLPPIAPDHPRSSDYIKYGYVAFIQIDSIDAHFLGTRKVKFRYKMIKETSNLTKMVIHTCIPNFDTIIGLIGKTKDSPNPCLVKLKVKNQEENPIEAKVYSFQSSTETFTDIDLVGKSVVITSRFEQGNNTFGLRGAIHDEFFRNENYYALEELHIFNISNMRKCDGPYAAWHPYNSTIRIVGNPNTDMATIGHETRIINNEDTNNFSLAISLYHMKCYADLLTSTFILYSARLAPNTQMRYEVFKDMKYIREQDKIALLLTAPTSTYFKGGLLYFTWGTDDMKAHFTSQSDMSGMDITSGKHIWTGGRNPFDDVVYHYRSDVTELFCYCYNDYQNSRSTKLCGSLNETTTNTICNNNSNNNNNNWDYTKNIGCLNVNVETLCTDYSD